MTAASTGADPRDIRRRRVVMAALLIGMFLAALDVLVVAPAMPSVVADLGGLPLYPWVFSAYLLASTVTAPIYGRLADTYGSKRFYLLGLGLFLAGSASAGASFSLGYPHQRRRQSGRRAYRFCGPEEGVRHRFSLETGPASGLCRLA